MKKVIEGFSEAQFKQKIYNQFINKLLMLLLTGVTAGACFLAALDYALVAQIPERSFLVMLLLVVSMFVCLGYWLLTFIRAKGVEGLRGLALFALIISIVASSAGGFGLYKNTINLRTYFYGERIVIKDKKETAQTLIDYIETWRHIPNYSLAHIADDMFYATVYNSKGESVTQLIVNNEEKESLTDIAVCLTDGTAVIVTDDAIERRLDVDNLTYIVKALEWVISGKADIERASASPELIRRNAAPADAAPETEYAVTISGAEKIEKFYSDIIGADAAKEMFNKFLENDASIQFNIALGTGFISVGSSLLVGGQASLLWYIENYTEVYDWTLGEQDWYTYDYQDADKNERMVEEAMYNVTTMLGKFSSDVGLDLEGLGSIPELDTNSSGVVS